MHVLWISGWVAYFHAYSILYFHPHAAAARAANTTPNKYLSIPRPLAYIVALHSCCCCTVAQLQILLYSIYHACMCTDMISYLHQDRQAECLTCGDTYTYAHLCCTFPRFKPCASELVGWTSPTQLSAEIEQLRVPTKQPSIF